MDSAKIIALEADRYDCFSLEIAANSTNAFEEIRMLCGLHLKNTKIGAGTILNMDLLHKAKEAGATFVLSPVCMTLNMIEFCKENNIICVPGAFSPTEIQSMKDFGADIIKIFPASNFPMNYLKAVMAPLGHLPLMVVGGVNAGNVKDYFSAGADYAGVGSGICDLTELQSGDRSSVVRNLKILSDIVKESAKQ